MFSSLSSAASSAASLAIGSSTTNPKDANKTEGGESTERVDPTKLFHEFPHPQDWQERVREVLENLKKTNTEIPSKMCPLGDVEATCRRFLVARRYNVEAAELMMRKAIEFRNSVCIGDAYGEHIKSSASVGFVRVVEENITQHAVSLLHETRVSGVFVEDWQRRLSLALEVSDGVHGIRRS